MYKEKNIWSWQVNWKYMYISGAHSNFRNLLLRGRVKHHPWLLNGIHMRNSELANHLQGWVTYLITGEHTDIKSKLTQKSFFFSRLIAKKWRLGFFFMSSGLMLKNHSDFSQQDLVTVPGLILHGCVSSFCNAGHAAVRSKPSFPLTAWS